MSHMEQEEHDATNAYLSLSETTDHDDPRWAFGTGFEDVEAEISAPITDRADGADLAAYCQMLGDDALIYSQRLAEWVANAPELEEEVALANIALDLLGQARVLLSRAGHIEGGDEDSLAFTRDQAGFRNIVLVEPSDELDFGRCVARLLIFSTWRIALLNRLQSSCDPVIAAVAGKGVKELTYHRDYAAQWLVRLGDGTPLSRSRMQEGLDAVWPYVGELFRTHPLELVDAASLRPEFDAVVDQALAAATLDLPTAGELAGVSGRTGRDGVHTEQMGFLLAELQSVARAMPDAKW